MSNPIPEEIRRRIRVSIWAYAYEFENSLLVADSQFDAEASKINPLLCTSYPGRDNSEIDAWFKAHFKPHTGAWIHNHPNLPRIKELCELAAQDAIGHVGSLFVLTKGSGLTINPSGAIGAPYCF